jgi:hypothetical protein
MALLLPDSGATLPRIAGTALGFIAAVSITLAVKGGCRALREIAIRTLGVALMAAALVAGGFSLRNAALAHLGLTSRTPAVEFEIRLPTVAATADPGRDVQVELLTDRNQMLARLDSHLHATEDGRTILRGQVALGFRTSERLIVLSLPGEARRAFRLRLPADPSRSGTFGPWHMADQVQATSAAARTLPDDSFAIRYRVL